MTWIRETFFRGIVRIPMDYILLFDTIFCVINKRRISSELEEEGLLDDNMLTLKSLPL